MKVYAWTLLTPGAWPNLTQGHDLTGTIYNWDYQTLLHTKYRSSGPFGFREEVFFSFSHCKSMETIYPRGVAKFDPRGMNGTIYVEDH